MLSEMLSGSLRAVEPPAFAVRQHLMEDASHPRHPLQKVRDFTASDKALIHKVHGYMAAAQLLGILNARLVVDVGDGVGLYTIDQLRTEIATATTAMPADASDWATLRKMLAKARRAGVLDLINEQVINDFAVVYSLNQKQMMLLKDILLHGNAE
jgi:hypothetical protein